MANDERRSGDLNRRRFLTAAGAGFTLGIGSVGTATADDSRAHAAKAAIAEETGTAEASHTVLDQETVRYDVLGEEYVDVKVYDGYNGTVEVVRTDADGTVVDKEVVEARAADAYRDEYGILDKELFQDMEAAPSDQLLDIVVQVEGPDKAAARAAVTPDDPDSPSTLTEELQRRISKRTGVVASSLEYMDDVSVEYVYEAAPFVDARATGAAIHRIEQLYGVTWIASGGYNVSAESGARIHDYDEVSNGDVVSRYDATGYAVGILESNGGVPEDDSCLSDLTVDPEVQDVPGQSTQNVSHANTVARAAAGEQQGTPGTAAGASVYATTRDRPDEEAIDYLSGNVPVVSTSFGHGRQTNGLLESDLKYGSFVFNRRLPIVNSAGNGGGVVTPPSRSFNVLSVAASNLQDVDSVTNLAEVKSQVRNAGSSTVAPPSRVEDRDKPEVSAVTGFENHCRGKDFIPKTSYAAPQVAGLVTLIKKFAEESDCTATTTGCASTGSYDGDDCANALLTADGAVKPEVARAVTMAAAEPMGRSALEVNGAGTFQAGPVEEIVSNGQFHVGCISKEDDAASVRLPRFEPGQVVTFSLSWLADVGGDRPFTDPESAHPDVVFDLLVRSCGRSGCEILDSSTAHDRAWQYVQVRVPDDGLDEAQICPSEWLTDDPVRQFCLAWHATDVDRAPEIRDVTVEELTLRPGVDCPADDGDCDHNLTVSLDGPYVSGGAGIDRFVLLEGGDVFEEWELEDMKISTESSWMSLYGRLEPDTEYEFELYAVDEAGNETDHYRETVVTGSE